MSFGRDTSQDYARSLHQARLEKFLDRAIARGDVVSHPKRTTDRNQTDEITVFEITGLKEKPESPYSTR